MPPKPRLVAIDLFSGCGGLTQGLKYAGFEIIGAIELDSLAAETYRLNHSEVHVWEENIASLSPVEVKRSLGLRRKELDLLAACPPCQGFSSMRTLNGSRVVSDERNDLVLRVLDYIEILRPKTIMLENVPGLAKDSRLTHLTDCLQGIGYHCEWSVLNAAEFGVPQRRRRFILLASLYGRVNLELAPRKRSTVRSAIAHLPAPSETNDPLHENPGTRSPKVMDLIRRIPLDGGSRLDIPLGEQLKCHQKCDGFKDVYGRMAWDEVAPTITGGCINPSKGRFLHPVQDRAITLREAALLQSFPQDYQFSLKRGSYAVAQMIGNALPPRFVGAHATTLVRHLRARYRKSA